MSSTPTEVARRYFALLGAGDLPGLAGLFSPDVVWHQPGTSHVSGTYRGTDRLFAHLGRFMELSAGTFRIDEVADVMGNGDLVAATLRFSASVAGRAVSMAGVDLMRVHDGRIVEVWLFSADQAAEDSLWDGALARTS
jgi:ketosteroid isomerase-like protein